MLEDVEFPHHKFGERPHRALPSDKGSRPGKKPWNAALRLFRIIVKEKFNSFEMNTVDVFVGNYTIIDKDVYKLWLDGFTANDAVTMLAKEVTKQYPSATMDLIMSDTLDHFRTYQMLERLLQYPTKFAEQLTFQIDPQTQRHLIETYYEFDNSVIREILGKKLSSRHRKDLDEVSDKTKVSLKSCRRQFDNVKRVFKIVEDLRGRLVHNIQAHFLLSDKLARKYAAIVFIANNRFETGKRKLQYLTFEDFHHCATCMIASWTCNSTHIKPDETDADLDREYLQELRDLKVLMEREVLDEHRALVCNRLKGKLNDRMYAETESSFKSMSRALVSIACGLNHSREARDIFVDIVEKFIEPSKHSKWSRGELELFLHSYMEAVHDLEAIKSFPGLHARWNRYIHTTSSCILCMYHP